jgi:hypothetical protein
VQQFWVFYDDLSNGFNIVSPDSIDEIARLNQPGPTVNSIATSKRKLSVTQPDLFGRFVLGSRIRAVKFGEYRDFPLTDRVEQVFRLLF